MFFLQKVRMSANADNMQNVRAPNSNFREWLIIFNDFRIAIYLAIYFAMQDDETRKISQKKL